MGNFNRIAVAMQETCDVCQAKNHQCTECKIIVDLGDRQVVVHGLTKRVTDVMFKTKGEKSWK